jgi:cell division inhibitor SepF
MSMAGAMRKMAVYLGLVEDDQYDDDSYDGVSGDRNRDQDREREADRGNVSRNDRYATDRTEPKPTETLRVTERDDDEFSRRRSSSERPANSRDWRNDTAGHDPVGAHPAGSRAKAPRPAKSGSEGMKITTLHPRSYNDARRIGEEFRNGTPVIMNLTELDDTDAKRIVDFAAGLVFGLRGSIERVTNKVFMLSPANVTVDAEAARARVEQESLRTRN